MDSVVPSTTILGDWFAQPLSVGRLRFILLVCERSRLAVLMPARDAKHLARNFPDALADVLVYLGIPPTAIDRELAEMRECAVAVTNNRSVLGSMNDFSQMIKWRLRGEPEVDLVGESLWLSRVLVGPLGYESPREVTARLLEPPPSR